MPNPLRNYSRIEEGVADDVDEEAQFSAVGPHRDPIHAPLTMELGGMSLLDRNAHSTQYRYLYL